MSRSKITKLFPLFALLILLASSFSCNSLSQRGIGGDWNPNALYASDIARLSLPERGNYDFDSTIITSQNEFDDFISRIQFESITITNPLSPEVIRLVTSSCYQPELHYFLVNTELLEYVNEWQIDFDTHNLILYRHIESSGSNIIALDEPLIEGREAIICINTVHHGNTDDEGVYYFAYMVGKQITSVTFDIEGEKDFSFVFGEEEIVSEEPPATVIVEETIVGEGASLTTTIAETEYAIEAYLWRDFMPICPPDGRPLTGVISIRPVNANSLTYSCITEDEITITHDSEIWETEFVEKRLRPSVWELVIRDGPKWGPGTTVSLKFELSTSYCTTLEKVDKTYTIVLKNVPIDMTC